MDKHINIGNIQEPVFTEQTLSWAVYINFPTQIIKIEKSFVQDHQLSQCVFTFTLILLYERINML